MKVTRYEENGKKYLEIISRQNLALHDLEDGYKKIQKKTWLNLYDSCNGRWKLTVQWEVL